VSREIPRAWFTFFFAVAACSWMPHWSCHYYRLETGSGFVVGSWEFSSFHSAASLIVYTALILMNLIAVVRLGWRQAAAVMSGVLHLALGVVHVYRLFKPFRFEVFGYEWSQGASLREVTIVIPFGLLCLWMARQR
jgi:uncharacterized membrane protein